MKKPHVYAITATCGRMACLRRSLSMFLEQDYPYEHTQIIYNNSSESLSLHIPEIYGRMENKHVILINRDHNSLTGKRYSSLGEIYNDILKVIPDNADLVYHMDDDDYFLPNHISEGVKGMQRADRKAAYKPRHSWFYHGGGMELMNNTLEPSIFIRFTHLKRYGYEEGKSVGHHLKWVNPLVSNNDILSEEGGPPTLIYNWHPGDIPVFKTSGAGDTPGNFQNYRKFSTDFGDRIVYPAPIETYSEVLKKAKWGTTEQATT